MTENKDYTYAITAALVLLLLTSIGILFASMHMPPRTVVENYYIIHTAQNGTFFEDVTVTAYTAREEECDSTPHVTALMEKPVPGRTVAVSRDLMFALGKHVYIPGVGVRVVQDLMAPRFTKRVDVLMPSVKMARTFGVQVKDIVFF